MYMLASMVLFPIAPGPPAGEYQKEFGSPMVFGPSDSTGSPPSSPMMEAIERWLKRVDPEAEAVPILLPGFSDSRWFRDAFPECVAYGFFPQRYMSLFQAAPLVHNADERIDVRDLGFAAGFYSDIARELLG